MDIINLSSKNKEEVILKVADFIINEKIIVFPTDTIYGLIGDATSEKAINKIFSIKKRNYKKALPVFVSSISMAKELALIGEKEEKFLSEVWPGKVTVVLKKRKDHSLPSFFGDTIGLRIPNYDLIDGLFEKIKRPLIGTSANVSGELESFLISDVLRQFKEEKPDLIVSVGNLDVSNPSTVVDLTKDRANILRAGSFPEEELLNILNKFDKSN